MKHKKLTKEEWKELIPTATYDELAAKTGYTVSYIKFLASSYGVHAKKKAKLRKAFHGFTDEEVREIISTHTAKKASEIIGISRKNIYYAERILGVKAVRSPVGEKAAGKSLMIAWLAKKFRYKEVGEAFGVSRQCVEQAYRMYGGKLDEILEVRRQKDDC